MNKVYFGDALEIMKTLDTESVQTVVTSPPYFGLRDYGMDGQIGTESSPQEYIEKLVLLFREVRRVLRDDGTVWLNLGDSYAGGGTVGAKRPGSGRADGVVDIRSQRNRNGLGRVDGLKSKDLIGIPWRVAFALQADGWYLRQDIIWAKPNPMPESVTDRCTKAHEYIFLLAKSEKYYFDNQAIKEPAVTKEGRPSAIVRDRTKGYDSKQAALGRARGGLETAEPLTRNKRSVWTVATKPYVEAHFATFPPALITPCILAGSRVGDIVLDPFLGSGTTASVAKELGRAYIGIELNPAYEQLIEARLLKIHPALL